MSPDLEVVDAGWLRREGRIAIAIAIEVVMLMWWVQKTEE